MDWDHLKQYTKVGQWNHFAISFNKRAFKFYLNGTRIINLPNVAAPARFEFIIQDENPYRGVANVVLAKGAVEALSAPDYRSLSCRESHRRDG